MKNKRGLCWMTMGIALILAALSLVLFNLYQDKENGLVASGYLSQLQKQIPETSDKDDKNSSVKGDSLLDEYISSSQDQIIGEENVKIIDSLEFIGYVTIPKLDIELPVLSEWSYDNLKVSPCRYSGSALSGDLIIAAHNYNSHFGRIGDLNSGDLIYFTDCSGTVRQYEVVQSELIDGYNVSAMNSGDSEWDLTLFTCTWSGANRVTVRASEIKDEPKTFRNT